MPVRAFCFLALFLACCAKPDLIRMHCGQRV